MAMACHLQRVHINQNGYHNKGVWHSGQRWGFAVDDFRGKVANPSQSSLCERMVAVAGE